ncbi:hypothetical protein R0137_08385 [Congregibacter brevis]|uniref:Uncharacterized protein n=1 Tax=Congregibacter brevis TaxID=3081201 RepID=A0ABZ0IGA2_9GAMM|nr:hypothetical protein R0137_08385 [Congregibacter sp. IMCC45268]
MTDQKPSDVVEGRFCASAWLEWLGVQSAVRVTGRVRRLLQEDRRRQLVAGFAIAGDRRTSDAYARPLR